MNNPETSMADRVPGLRRLCRIPGQMLGTNPFEGDCRPTRVPILFGSRSRPAFPFPHRWNYQRPIAILETYFHDADDAEGAGKHNRYMDAPGFPPVLVTRDPGVIRAILTATGDRDGQFDRDTLPSAGIARATGSDTLLFANGPFWRRQRKAAAAPFGKTALFQPEVFRGFAQTLSKTVGHRLEVFRQHLQENGCSSVQMAVEAEIKPLMLELLVACYFGAEIAYEDIRQEYVPAIERLIDHIVTDTVTNRFGIPTALLAGRFGKKSQIAADFAALDKLTDLVLEARGSGAGMWSHFKIDAQDEELRSNIKVFLAGALEATTSYATWTISHLARHTEAQERVFAELKSVDDYTPAAIREAKYFGYVMEETLRLTPSLYFLPRRATKQTWIETADGRRMQIPAGTHILLDVWHANRNEDFWGVDATGFRASEFAPERWEQLTQQKSSSKDQLHFGFGHGPRVCPGKHLGQLEVYLVVGAFVKLFRFTAASEDNTEKAGVSTKPQDGTLIDMTLRAAE
ncbi:cytochrome P450 [Allorhodopirellula solitaria]|uniref:Epi-isozizaene 5-monooxygenase/(E)-beta-farnesene synthase n=1 Tax=Allorhodopirellula solitaria TaxID=2527987 RepID=A0A5C5WZI0_9BACT|nr:cytochrome P450 [Allorhodopirellula solitaria]TWT55501.1 Epi-isozizaene 5-monooxygenase/(E)-beta-farnesene synthase [Allorhodopirellula solitaria]